MPDIGAGACPTTVTANDTSAMRELPAYFMRHWPQPRSVSFETAQQTYGTLKRWGRTRFQIVKGKLYFSRRAADGAWGCVLRRTPILAWSLLELLERYPTLPDVDIPVNCRDKPTFWDPHGKRRPRPGFEAATTSVPRDGHAALAFSYTTARTFTDVPLPDYTYWGLPYADLPPWREWLRHSGDPNRNPPWERKRDGAIWVGSPTHPLRAAFQRCARARFAPGQLTMRMAGKEAMETLAWRCPPYSPPRAASAAPAGHAGAPEASSAGCTRKPSGWTPMQEQCRYRFILHFPGISDWLEHLKHQLACGSVSLFVVEAGADRRATAASSAAAGPAAGPTATGSTAAAGPTAGVAGAPNGGHHPGPPGEEEEEEERVPLSPPPFEHFDFGGPLLREDVHFVRVVLPPGAKGRASVCERVGAVLDRLRSEPGKARCLAERGANLSRSISMAHVYAYYAEVLTRASRAQEEDVARRVVRAEGSWRVTKANFFRFISNRTRPWIEHTFRRWHREAFKATPLLPPRQQLHGLFS